MILYDTYHAIARCLSLSASQETDAVSAEAPKRCSAALSCGSQSAAASSSMQPRDM